MMQIISVAHALRLCHIDLLREMPIKKGIIYIKFLKSPLAIEDNAKHSIVMGFITRLKVNARLLVKAFSNKASFITCNRAIMILFDAKHPFIAHYILPRSQGNQSLSTISNESIIFFLHHLNPLGILESLSDSAGFRDSWNYGSEAIFRLGLRMAFLERVCMG